ncbi:MAG: alpha/beta fold hydrolase, partial [Actinomycetota bacterium]
IDGPDGPIWVQTAGSGEPVTVFAHGVTGSTGETAPLAAATAGTSVLFDFRGHGRSSSPPPQAGYDHPAMRRDLQTVAGRFSATRAVGISMGAGAILNLCADDPSRFERLVLITPASIDAPNAAAESLLLEMAERLERDGIEATLAWQLEDNDVVHKRPYWRSMIQERTRRMNRDGVPRALRAYVDGRPPIAEVAALRAIRAPVLIVAHEGDPVHDAAVARRLCSLLPSATLRCFDEPLSQWDDVGAFAALIGEFLGS